MIGLFVRFVWLLVWVVALPIRLARRVGARTRRGTHLVVEVEGAVTELPTHRRLWPPRAKQPLSLYALRPALAAAAADPKIVGLVLIMKGLRGGSATATSLRRIVLEWRVAGKRAVVHLPLGGGTRETYVASAADWVLLSPPSGLAAVGFLSATRYVRGALDKAGIVPEIVARGRFKTAAERIERSSMGDAQREQLTALLDGIYGEVTAGLAQGRRVDEGRARAMIDGAPYSGQEAVDAGLVDALAYEDQLEERIGDKDQKARLVPAAAWWGPRAAMRPAAFRSRGVIGVVSVHGAIAGASGMPFQRMAIDDRVIAAVRLARMSPVVRGVILHIDSPGGSALASDRMHHELAALAAEKPLVACMADVAASGGYYVAACAHAIVAQPTTITGSIGVIGARVVLDPLLSRLGVSTEIVARGAHARLLDPFVALAPDDLSALEREIEHTYQAFLRVVAEGRRRSVDEIHSLAQGRVWTGADAHARGLVDHLGGFDEALKVLRGRLGRGADRLRVVTLKPPRVIPPLDPPEQKATQALVRMFEALGAEFGVDPSWLAFRNQRVLVLDPLTVGIAS